MRIDWYCGGVLWQRHAERLLPAKTWTAGSRLTWRTNHPVLGRLVEVYKLKRCRVVAGAFDCVIQMVWEKVDRGFASEIPPLNFSNIEQHVVKLVMTPTKPKETP